MAKGKDDKPSDEYVRALQEAWKESPANPARPKDDGEFSLDLPLTDDQRLELLEREYGVGEAGKLANSEASKLANSEAGKLGKSTLDGRRDPEKSAHRAVGREVATGHGVS